MSGADECCTRTPHLEGEEVFISLKRKANLPVGSEFDSHQPDKISISHSRIQTRSTCRSSKTVISPPVELLHSSVEFEGEQVPLQVEEPKPKVLNHHIIVVQETACYYSHTFQKHLPRLVLLNKLSPRRSALPGLCKTGRAQELLPTLA